MAIEDLTTYTEEDLQGDLTVIAARVTGVDVHRDYDYWVYDDKGANHFDALDILCEMYISSACEGTTHQIAGWGISNTDASPAVDWATTDIWVRGFRLTTGKYYIDLTRGYIQASDYWECAADTLYYVTLKRPAGSNTVTLDIYSDAERTDKLVTLTVNGFGVATKWRYCYAFVGLHDEATVTAYWDGYFQNFDLQEVPAGWTGKISGVTNPAKIMGVAVANIAKVKGVS